MAKKISSDSLAKIVVVAIIAILCVTIFVSYLQNNKSDAGKPQQMNGGRQQKGTSVITVSTYKTELTAIESIIKLNGDISSKSEVSIYPDTSGKLIRLLKDDGDTVKKGEVIAYVDPSKPGSAYVTSPVFSTVSGTVIGTPITVGDTVTSNTAIASVGALDDLKITIDVSEKYSNDLKVGLPGYVSLTSIPNETFKAVITKISPVVDSTKRTIEVTLDFVKQDKRIKPGMFGSVNLATKRSEKTIVVPKSALATYNAENVVYVVNADMKAERKDVTTGLSNDTQVEITEGLSIGETVVIAGSVTNGSSVKFANQ